jgi:hypothetical protein
MINDGQKRCEENVLSEIPDQVPIYPSAEQLRLFSFSSTRLVSATEALEIRHSPCKWSPMSFSLGRTVVDNNPT